MGHLSTAVDTLFSQSKKHGRHLKLLKQVKSWIVDLKKPLKGVLKSNLNKMFSKAPTPEIMLANFINVGGLYTVLMEKEYVS